MTLGEDNDSLVLGCCLLYCTAATCLGSPCITKSVRLEVRGMRNKRVSYGIYSQYFLSYEEKIRVNDKQHKT